MVTHSVCRCEKRNKEAKGSSNSQHLVGKAMDFHINGVSSEMIYRQLKALQPTMFPELRGLFLYDWGVHIDVRNDTFRCRDYREGAKA